MQQINKYPPPQKKNYIQICTNSYTKLKTAWYLYVQFHLLSVIFSIMNELNSI